MKLLKKVEGHKYAVGSGNSAVPAIFGSLGSSRRLPSYNLLVNFASLLEGYVRWDKKYLEWYPGPTIASTPPFSFSSLSLRSCYQHSLSLCATSTADSIPGAASSSISSNGGAPPPLAGCRVRIPELPPSGHWSAPLASTLCQPSATSAVLLFPFSVSFSFSSYRQPFALGGLAAKNMNITPLLYGYAPDFYSLASRTFY